MLLTAFSGFATLLASVGVTAYAVRQRRREIAIRMAVGAHGPQIVALFVRRSAVVIAISTVAGLGASIAIGEVLAQQLYGISALDATTMLASSMK